MANYLITGAAGFIGSNLVEHLLNQGETVTGLDNLCAGSLKNLEFTNSHPNKYNFSFIQGDIRNIDLCNKACQNIDYVLHQAALGSVPRSLKEPALYNENNITGTLNMLIAAKDAKVKRFVFASSSSIYGDTPTLPKIETMTPNPKSPYAVTKLVGEQFCKLFTTTYDLPTVILRYFNVFGPKQSPTSQYAAAIPKFITGYLSNTPPTIYGDGTQTRDFTFIKNVIQANLNACQAPNVSGEHFNIGCGSRISLNKLTQIIQTITKSPNTPIYTEPRAGDVKDSLACTKKGKALLNLNNFIELETGLAQTIQWYQQQEKESSVLISG